MAKSWLQFTPATALAAVVLLLVPFGRGIQHSASELAVLLPAVAQIIGLGMIFTCALVFVWQSGLLLRRNPTLALGQVTLLVALLTWTFFHIHGIWIELSHIALYGGFYIMLRSVASTFRPSIVTVFLLGLSLCLLDEGLQYLHPQRIGDLRDLQLNVAALIIGAVFIEPHLQFR